MNKAKLYCKCMYKDCPNLHYADEVKSAQHKAGVIGAKKAIKQYPNIMTTTNKPTNKNKLVDKSNGWVDEYKLTKNSKQYNERVKEAMSDIVKLLKLDLEFKAKHIVSQLTQKDSAATYNEQVGFVMRWISGYINTMPGLIKHAEQVGFNKAIREERQRFLEMLEDAKDPLYGHENSDEDGYYAQGILDYQEQLRTKLTKEK